MSEEKKDFVVKDRRIFSEEDDAKDENAEAGADREDTPRASASDQKNREPEDREQDDVHEGKEQTLLPEINFATFVVSLNASALLHLGAIEDPSTGKTEKDLPMAKQTIDILSLLAQKTAGNLTNDEENLLKNILYDLRIIYVKESG